METRSIITFGLISNKRGKKATHLHYYRKTSKKTNKKTG